MPIYAALGVAEVWRWSRETLTVYQLLDGKYVERSDSFVFPGFPLDLLRAALARRHAASQTILGREFQDWLQQNS